MTIILKFLMCFGVAKFHCTGYPTKHLYLTKTVKLQSITCNISCSVAKFDTVMKSANTAASTAGLESIRTDDSSEKLRIFCLAFESNVLHGVE